MSRGSSRRWIFAPTSWVTAMSVSSRRDLGLPGRSRAHGLGRGLHGLDDVHVTGAAAEVAFEALADLVFGRIGVLLEKVGRGHDEAGRAVAALQAVLVPESLLDGVQLIAVGHALDGREVAAVGLDGEHRAALDRLAVHVDRARAALAGVAADVRSGQAYDIPEVVHEQQSRFDLVLVLTPVDGDSDLVLHPAPSWLAGGALEARAAAFGRPRGRNSNHVRTCRTPTIRLLLVLKCNWKIPSRSTLPRIGCSPTCSTSTRWSAVCRAQSCRRSSIRPRSRAR